MTNDFQVLIGMLQSIVSIFALIIGGWWSWRVFIRKRLKYPRAKIEHKITHRRLNSSLYILIVDITITNTSETLLTLTTGRTQVRKILPPSSEFMESINVEKPTRDQSIHWDLVAHQPEDWGKDGIQIEPGESEQLHYKFVVSSSIQTITVYSYFPYVENRVFQRLRKNHRQLGWSLTSIYDCKVSREKEARRVNTN